MEPNWEIIFEVSAYPANSEGITLDSSTAVHGLHMQSAGAFVTNCKKKSDVMVSYSFKNVSQSGKVSLIH